MTRSPFLIFQTQTSSRCVSRPAPPGLPVVLFCFELRNVPYCFWRKESVKLKVNLFSCFWLPRLGSSGAFLSLWDGIHQSFLVPSIFLLSFLPTPNSSTVYLVARAWKFLPTLSESPILLSFFQEILLRNLVCSLG
jgi:hypothetical protein